MTLALTVGDFANTAIGLPGIQKGSEVQVCGVGINKGKFALTAVLFDSMGNKVNIIGPYPIGAFTLSRQATGKELTDLIKYVSNYKE